jgi:hypothetical protein
VSTPRSSAPTPHVRHVGAFSRWWPLWPQAVPEPPARTPRLF